MMKKARFFPNVITAFGLACGLFVIFKLNTLETNRSDYEIVLISTFLILAAALADFIDGALARALHGESEFGFVFDSMSDAISFGVAPSVLMLKTLSLDPGTFLSFFSATGAMVYSLSGVLRLVRFSVKGKELKVTPEAKAAAKRHFTGLPITASAVAAISINLLFLSPGFQQWVPISQDSRAIALSCLMIFLGYLMVCRLKFPSLKMLHFRIPSFQWTFLVVVMTVFVIYGILYCFSLTLTLIIWAYIVVSLILSFIRLIAGKKSKTLQEFEPDSDDPDHTP